jgi:zinc protease
MKARALPLLLLLLVPLLTLAAKPTTELPQGVTKVTQVEGVTEYRLANGLQILLAPSAAKPTTTVNVTYRVGSRMEDYGETGMAHLLEHLMFKGSPKHPDITAQLSRRGMSPNGTTWYDRTNYFESFATNQDNLEWALRMEADRMVNSYISRKDLDSEMTVVRNEMESGENDPAGILMDKTMAAAFQWHNYGKSTIGARADVENVSIPHLQAFYHRYYQPDNATLVIAGQFDEARVWPIIMDSFAKIAKPKRVLFPTYTLDPVQEGEREVVLRRTGDVAQVEVVYHTVPAAHPQAAALDVLTDIMGNPASGRLYQALVKTGLSTAVDADFMALAEPGVLFFQADVAKGQDQGKVKDVLLETIESLKQHPFTQEEVDRAKARLANEWDNSFNDPQKFGIHLSSAIADGDWRLFFLERDRTREVTVAQVQEAAQTWLKSTNRTLGLFIPTAQPDRVPAPAKVDVAAQFKEFKGGGSAAEGEAFDSSLDNIAKHVEWIAPTSGLKMALLTKKTRGAVVNAQLSLHFGSAETLKGKATQGALVGALLNRGAAGLSRQQIQDRFLALRAQVGFSGSATGVNVGIQAHRQDLPAVLELVVQILKTPSFPEEELKQVKEAELSDLDQARSDPQALVGKAMSRHFNHYPRGDVRYASTFDEAAEDINQVSREQLIAFHQQFYGADHAEVSVVGDFDTVAVKAVLEKSLQGWSTPQPYERVLDPFHEMKGERIQIEVADKANAVFALRQMLPLKDDDPQAPALMLANTILGEGFLSSRLATRIRQKDGLSYGVGSFLRLNDALPNSQFGAYAIFAPQNLARLETAFSEEMVRAIRDGFSQKELNEAKEAVLQSRALARAQDSSLTGTFSRLLFEGRTLDFLKQRETALRGQTLGQVNGVLPHTLDPAKFVEVVGGSFAGAKP